MNINITDHNLEDFNKYVKALRYTLGTFTEELSSKDDDRLENLYFALTVPLEKIEELLEKLEASLNK